MPMRLLLVEDDDQIADFVTQGLQEAGYESFDPDEVYNRIFQSRTRRRRSPAG